MRAQGSWKRRECVGEGCLRETFGETGVLIKAHGLQKTLTSSEGSGVTTAELGLSRIHEISDLHENIKTSLQKIQKAKQPSSDMCFRTGSSKLGSGTLDRFLVLVLLWFFPERSIVHPLLNEKILKNSKKNLSSERWMERKPDPGKYENKKNTLTTSRYFAQIMLQKWAEPGTKNWWIPREKSTPRPLSPLFRTSRPACFALFHVSFGYEKSGNGANFGEEEAYEFVYFWEEKGETRVLMSINIWKLAEIPVYYRISLETMANLKWTKSSGLRRYFGKMQCEECRVSCLNLHPRLQNLLRGLLGSSVKTYPNRSPNRPFRDNLFGSYCTPSSQDHILYS